MCIRPPPSHYASIPITVPLTWAPAHHLTLAGVPLIVSCPVAAHAPRPTAAYQSSIVNCILHNCQTCTCEVSFRATPSPAPSTPPRNPLLYSYALATLPQAGAPPTARSGAVHGAHELVAELRELRGDLGGVQRRAAAGHRARLPPGHRRICRVQRLHTRIRVRLGLRIAITESHPMLKTLPTPSKNTEQQQSSCLTGL